jgi:hypothetical protein
MSKTRNISGSLALAAVAVALGAATTSAAPIESYMPGADQQPGAAAKAPDEGVAPSSNATPIAISEDRFDWGDATVGAGVALCLAAIAAATARSFDRRRHGVA